MINEVPKLKAIINKLFPDENFFAFKTSKDFTNEQKAKETEEIIRICTTV